MQVDYEFVYKINNFARSLADDAITATYEEDIMRHGDAWNHMYDMFQSIILECNKHMEEIGNI